MSITKSGRRHAPISTVTSGSRQHGSRAMSLGSSCRSPSPSAACFQSPSGLTSSDESEGDSPRFSFLAPSGYTDSDSEEEGEVVQSQAAGTPGSANGAAAGVRVPTPPQRAAMDRRALARQQLEEATQCTLGQFHAAVLEIDAEEAAQVAAVEAAMRRLRAEDAEAAAARAEAADGARAAVLAALQDAHARKAAAMSASVAAVQQVAAEAAAKKAAAEAAAREAAEKQRAEAERARAQAEEAKRREEEATRKAAAAEEAARQEAAAAAARKGAGADERNGAGKAGALRCAPAALEAEKRCWDELRAAEDLVRPLVEDEGQKRERRKLDKFITLNVQQISGTQQQVGAKAGALSGFLRQLPPAPAAYARLQLAARLVAQCECQVALSHAFAFPLAEVAAAVAADHPDFLPVLLAKLHHACMLTVPKLHVHNRGRDLGAHLRKMGYRELPAEQQQQGGKGERGQKGAQPEPDTAQFESTDAYSGRLQGYVLFLGALLQSARLPDGLPRAWQYLARLMNHLPTTRLSATVLEAFLKAAGFRLASVYGRQFQKLLAYADAAFLGDLERQGDPDARAVHSRLRTYVRGRQWATEPEGRRMPMSDLSAREHA